MTTTRTRTANRGSRTPESRQRLIDAAIESIVAIGYARTSVGEVVSRAGMTKGAHVYYFRSKLDLMKLTVEHLFEQVHDRLSPGSLSPPRTLQEMESYLQVVADVTLAREGVALYEVWMASRTDPALRNLFARLEARNERFRDERLANAFGIDTANSTDLQMLMKGATLILRGLALQHILRRDAARSDVWMHWRRKLATEILVCVRKQRRTRATQYARIAR